MILMPLSKQMYESLNEHYQPQDTLQNKEVIQQTVFRSVRKEIGLEIVNTRLSQILMPGCNSDEKTDIAISIFPKWQVISYSRAEWISEGKHGVWCCYSYAL